MHIKRRKEAEFCQVVLIIALYPKLEIVFQSCMEGFNVLFIPRICIAIDVITGKIKQLPVEHVTQ